MLDQIKKSFSALTSVFNLRNKKRSQERFTKYEGDEDDEIDEEYEDDEIPTIEEENEAMGSIKAGDHGKIKGFNRRIIKGIAVGIIIIFACALMYVVQDSSDTPQQQQARQEEAAKAGNNKDKMPGSYEELAQYNQALNGKNKQQNPNDPNNPNNQAVKVTQQDPTQVQQRQQVAQTLPQIPSSQMPSYSPYQLPSQVAQEDPAEKEAREKEKSLAERLKAAISFGIGGGGPSANGGVVSENTAQAAAPAQSGANGSTGMQPQVQQMSAPSNVGMGLATMSMQTYSPMTIMAGTVIPAALISGINSDVPGQVTAQIQTDVYDTLTGRYLLIPAGSRLIGTFGNDIKNGRVSVTFSTLQMPNGVTFSIGNSMIAVDKAGYTGIKGHVNGHSGKVIGNGLLTSAFTALASMAAGNVSNTSGTYSAGQLAMQGAVANMMSTASTMFNKAANLQETVTVEPGMNFNIYVSSPLDFSGVDM